MSLATSKLNSTSERFQQQLKSELRKFGKVLSRVNLGEVKAERRRVDALAVLDEGDIEEIQGFVSALIASKQNQREEGNGVGDRGIRATRRLQVSDIIQLVKCKANHASEEAIGQIERMLGSIRRYVESFEVQQSGIYLDGYEQEKYEDLNDSEIRRSQMVVQELKELLRDG